VSGARAIHRVEFLALALVLVGAAVWQKDQLGGWFWFFLLAPDLFGLVPASLLGRSPRRGLLPARDVPLYNVWHTFTVPIVAWVAALLLLAATPWPLLG